MIPVCVGRYQDLVAGNVFCQLPGDLMGHLRGDGIVRTEGLDHVVVHSAVGVPELPFGVHEFHQSGLGYTVDAGDQGTPFVGNLVRFAAVGDDTVETAHGLGFLTAYKFYDRHRHHRFRFRMSDSKELTCAYASVNSRSQTVFTLPM